MRKLLLLCLCTVGLTLGAQDIVLGVNPGNSPPYLIGPVGAPTSGIVYDIGLEVAKELGVKVLYKEVSRNRVETELLGGGITAIPILNPGWTNNGDKLIFSPPLFEEKNVFIVPKAKAAGYTTMDSFSGLVIGGNIGYFYADPFIKAVEAKKVTREDVNASELNFNKLLAGRIGAFIISDILGAYELKTKPQYASLGSAPYVLSQHNIHWVFAGTNRAQAERVGAVLLKLRDNGTIARILAKYK